MSIILRGDREVLSVWGDSDSVAITPLAHPTKQDGVLGNAHDAPSEPNKLHSAFSSARNRWQRHKPTPCVTNGRKGCSYLRQSLSFFNTTRFLKIPLVNSTPLNITCTSHTWDPTYTQCYPTDFPDSLPSRPTWKAPTIMRNIQFLSPFLSQWTLSFLSSPSLLNPSLILTSLKMSFLIFLLPLPDSLFLLYS